LRVYQYCLIAPERLSIIYKISLEVKVLKAGKRSFKLTHNVLCPILVLKFFSTGSQQHVAGIWFIKKTKEQIESKMGKIDFTSLGKRIRAAEKDLTKELVKWRCKKTGQTLPDNELLDKTSEHIVDEAHKLTKKTGQSVFSGLKQAKNEFLKAYRNKDEE
jgi:hypothetical protein